MHGLFPNNFVFKLYDGFYNILCFLANHLKIFFFNHLAATCRGMK